MIKSLSSKNNSYSRGSNLTVSIFLYFFAIVLSILFMKFFKVEAAVYLLLLLLGFGISVSLLSDKLTFWQILIVSPAVIFVVLPTILTFFSILGIGITLQTIIVILVFLFLVVIFSKGFSLEKLSFQINFSDILAFSIFILAISAKILSIFKLQTPNLSDEITHSYYTSILIDTGKPAFFYSPAMHIFSASSNLLGGYNPARQILLITNFFSAYAGLIGYLFIKNMLGKSVPALIVSLYFSLGGGLTYLFINAGKNAFIIGFSILLFFMYSVYLYNQSLKTKDLLLSTVALLSVFLTHYALGLLACIYLLAIFIPKGIKGEKSSWRLLAIYIGAILASIYVLYTYKIYILQGQSPSADMLGNINSNTLESFRTYFTTLFVNLKNSTLFGFTNLSLASIVGGTLLILWRVVKGIKKRQYISLILFFVLSMVVSLVIHLFSIQYFSMVKESFFLMVFFFSSLLIATMLSSLYEVFIKFIPKKIAFYIFTLLLCMVATLASYKIYVEYKAKLETTVVKDSDIKMFDWIDENISNNEAIVIDSFGYQELILPSDAGGWIEVFTKNKVSARFWEFSSEEVYKNFAAYSQLQQNPKDCNALNYFKESGYGLYYQGAKDLVVANISDRNTLIEYGWRILFSIGDSLLFELPTCE